MSNRCFSFLCICLLSEFYYFEIFIVGMYFVMNGIPIIFCFISVMWNVCLNGLLTNLCCSIVRVRTMKNWIFS